MEVNLSVLVGGGTLLVAISTLVAKISDNGNHKRKKIYERIEEERKDAENKYVSTKLCDERSGNIEKQLVEIGSDVKTLLRKNGAQ